MKNKDYTGNNIQDTTFAHFEVGFGAKHGKEGSPLSGDLPLSPVDAFKPNFVDQSAHKNVNITPQQVVDWVAEKERINNVLSKKDNFRDISSDEPDHYSLNDVESALRVAVTPLTYMIKKRDSVKDLQSSLDDFC